MHKPNVWIDLSGWSPKYFPPQLVQYANTLLKDRMLFGSDFPLITPDRWMKDFEEAGFKRRGEAADPEGQRDAAAEARLSRAAQRRFLVAGGGSAGGASGSADSALRRSSTAAWNVARVVADVGVALSLPVALPS